jgi:hypothetical protein
MTAKWRLDAIRDGFVCVDCHEPVNKADRKDFIQRGGRCQICATQIDQIQARTKWEHTNKVRYS